MTLDSAIQHCEEVAKEKEEDAIIYHNCAEYKQNLYEKGLAKNTEKECKACAEEHRQLAEWLKELKVFKSRKGQWLRMSDLSEQEDDRYECSYCGNVVHRRNEMDLYTFNSWCGRCGSDNSRKIEVEE